MEWTRYREDERGLFYYKKEIFNGYTYHLEVWINSSYKTEMFWFALSSGKKRKDLEIFEEKEKKSGGGMQALLWAKHEILNCLTFFKNPLKKTQYLCIGWADSRRRNIYSRLQKEGFIFAAAPFGGEKCLMKKVL